MRTKLQYSKKMFMRLARPVFRYSAATVVLLLASGAVPFQCSTSDDLALGIPLQTGNVWTYGEPRLSEPILRRYLPPFTPLPSN